jgi:hypothetical protein
MIPGAAAEGAAVRSGGVVEPSGAVAGGAVIAGVPAVGDPFADVAEEVVEAPGVWGEVADGEEAAGADGVTAFVVAVVGVGRGDVVLSGEDLAGSGAAGVLPFGLAGQSMENAGGIAEAATVVHGVIPGDADDGKVG